MRVFGLIAGVSLIFFVGCADKRIASNYYKSKNYEKAYEEYYKFAKRGFPDAADKVARLIYFNKVNKPPYIERKYALIAYKNGYNDAALYVADSYFREKNYKEALKWYDKVSFDKFRIRDFENYLTCVESLDNIKEKVAYLDKLNAYAQKSDNPKLQTILGKYYLQESPFYNPQRAEKLLQKAYDKGYYQAGVVLGIFYIKNGKKQEGYEILKDVAYKDKRAAYYLGNYLYDEMITKEKLLNSGCITCGFDTPEDFFVKKLTIYKYNDLFTRKNVKKAYDISYKLGNKKALYQLIRLDIEDNTFELTPETYSGFDLKGAVSYLKSKNDVESKLILAKIYEKYLYLNSYKKAKEIYKWYEKINKLQADWHLYQYEKRFENRVDLELLSYLVEKKFVPAIVEMAYQMSIQNKDIQNNKKVLEYYANQGNILALNYLGSLYSREILTPKTKSIDYYKQACILEKKPFYIPSEDLKIANYDNDVLKNENKALTINYYYAQMKNRQAQLYISKFYKNHCNYDKLKTWLDTLVKEADKKGEALYYTSVLERYIDGDYKKALNALEKDDSLQSDLVLARVYANGWYVDFDPKKAEEYYQKAINKGYKPAILNIAALYEKINVNGKYNNKIVSLYNEAINAGLKNAKIKLAKFYISQNEKQKALRILKSMPNNPKASYLLYLLTGNLRYVKNGDTNYGYLLLAKAEVYSKKAPRRALYYAFRAMLCNTPKTPKVAIELMKRINNARVIDSIYKRAKRAPKCYLN
ncbi:tetratricopeptide repeat protein [Caminibacter pacificus]|uniref:beta-lactamase n=1 Tax=Caminibacter pacificus TaxID=1424653 RepID=A0AAJ4RCS5_9BACT|nr:hypothetical protein [Caminibacter pacificus]QCI27764.1 hypothetical protein C6V80_01915 [Caminibacter pacificus]ROR40061.1 hypothetical protein EDC58_1045 [Caminibacter pacificus]